MHFTTRGRRALAAVATATALIAGSMFSSSAANAAVAPPAFTKIAALGDSISQAAMTCSSLLSCPANSWSTGTNTSVNSHFLRLRASSSPTITAVNYSASSAASGSLNAQAQKLAGQGVQYVTIDIGANDACTKTVGAMTPTATFRANIDAALATIRGAGNPQVLLVTIPNLKLMYDLNKSSTSARLAWALLGVCQSMLANPTSTKPADVQRRDAVQARVNEFNAALADACAASNGAGGRCVFDNFTVANYPFTKSDISTRDYFHPSLTGQANLSRITWAANGWL